MNIILHKLYVTFSGSDRKDYPFAHWNTAKEKIESDKEERRKMVGAKTNNKYYTFKEYDFYFRALDRSNVFDAHAGISGFAVAPQFAGVGISSRWHEQFPGHLGPRGFPFFSVAAFAKPAAFAVFFFCSIFLSFCMFSKMHK